MHRLLHTGLMAALVLAVTGHTAVASAGSEKAPDPAIAEGVRLHDKGLYDKAIEKYREALSRDPANVSALYEMAFSYYAKKDLPAALDAATRGTAFDDPLKPALYAIIGNIRDDQGDSVAAVAAYRSGIEANPDVPLLHFNLGVTYVGRSEWAPARVAFQQALSLKPDHSSSHYYLAYAYAQDGYKIPSLLAYTRFLLLEPTGERAQEAVRAIDRLFETGYAKDKATGNVTLTPDKDSRRDEGDFSASELGLLLSHAASTLEDKPGVPPKLQRLSAALAIATEASPNDSHGFASDYYLPYFRAIQGAGFLETIPYLALQCSGLPEVTAWLSEHKQRSEAFRVWSASYKWPRPPSRR